MLWIALAFAQDEPAEPELDEDDIEVVVVTASRSASKDHPVAVEVVSREDILESGAESLAEVLEEQPGVLIDRTVTGTSVRLQGLNPEHTLILVDGQRMLGRKDGVIDLSRIAIDSIERIEIVKGPSSSLYGSDAMGGVVHIVTRQPSDVRETGLRFRAGTLGRVDAAADLSLAKGRISHKAQVGWHTADAFDLDPSDEATTASGYDQGDVDYAVRVDTSDDSEVDGRFGYMQRRLEGVNSNEGGAVFDRRQIIEDARASLGGWVTPSATSKVSARLSGAVYRDQFISDQRASRTLDSQSNTVERQTELTVQVDQQATAAGSHFFTVGMDGLVQDLESDRLGSGKANRQRFAIFGQDLWAIGDEPKLQLSPGVRLDVDSLFGAAFTPRIAGSFTMGQVVIRAGGGTGFRAPDFRELFLLFENPGVGYIVSGNEDLKPERSRSANAGFDWRIGRDVNLSSSGFFNDVTNLIQVGNTDIEPGALQVFGYENVARARTAGFEMQWKVDPDPIAIDVGYAYTWTRDLDLERPLDNQVPHRLSGSFGIDLPENLFARVQGSASSPRTMFVEDDGIQRAVDTDPLTTTDIRIAWRDERFEVFTGVDNVFNALGNSLNPLVPRFFYAGFSARGRKEAK